MRNRIGLIAATLLTAAGCNPGDPGVVEKGLAKGKSLKSQTRLQGIGRAFQPGLLARPPQSIGYGGSADSPNLSWRVEVLSVLGQQPALARKFRRDKPWDAPEHKELLSYRPQAYESPGAPGDDKTLTHYRAVASPKGARPSALFTLGGRRPRNVSDGAGNTIMVVEAEQGVPWTKPDPIVYTKDGPPPKLGFFYAGNSHVLMANGAVKVINESIDPEVLRAITTRDGGELVPPDALN